VVTTYQSVSIPREVMTRSADDAARDLEGMFGLGWKNYFLYFGAIEPKKNLARIIEGHLASGARAPLVVIGGRAWLSDKETALLKTVQQRLKNADSRILQLDYLPYNMLMTLVRGARATLFPSLYEGFGLPVLESMLLGTAVLTSTAGSLPEVAGHAALLVDPYDANAISAGIRRLDADGDLRGELETRGREQAARFSEAAYQARLRELYAPFAG
jgi:glycosyltransferase involved in cell wall biosynthesis